MTVPAEPPVEPQWLFEHSDETGTVLAIAEGLLQLTDPTGHAITLHVAGEHSDWLDPTLVVLALGIALGKPLAAFPEVSDGWQFVDDPPGIQVGSLRLSTEQAWRLGGQLGAALMQTVRSQIEASRPQVEGVAARIAGRPLADLTPRQRISAVAAARRVLTPPPSE